MTATVVTLKCDKSQHLFCVLLSILLLEYKHTPADLCSCIWYLHNEQIVGVIAVLSVHHQNWCHVSRCCTAI